MCCYGHILHPISTDLLLLCGVLMTTVGRRWLALISFVSLIMCSSQGGLRRVSSEAWLAPLFVLDEPAAPSQKGKSSLTCREVRSAQPQGQKAQHESSLKDDMARGHIYRLVQRWLQLRLSGLPAIRLAPCSSIEINYSANNFWGPHFCDIEPLHSLLIASV